MNFEEGDWRLVHVVHHDQEGLDDLSSTVARGIAAAKGVEPTELQPPLAAVVRLEAIDDLFARRESPIRVEFLYAGYKVTIRSDDRIRIHEPVESTTSEPGTRS